MGTHNRKTPADPNLALRIELARRRAGMTQAQLAKRLKRKGAAISHWESGRFEPPRNMMRPIADVLGVTQSWLSGEQIVGDAAHEIEAILLRFCLEQPELLDQLRLVTDPERFLEILKEANRLK
jgi:transcriptional regulator with XRE-family HTH domain